MTSPPYHLARSRRAIVLQSQLLNHVRVDFSRKGFWFCPKMKSKFHKPRSFRCVPNQHWLRTGSELEVHWRVHWRGTSLFTWTGPDTTGLARRRVRTAGHLVLIMSRVWVWHCMPPSVHALPSQTRPAYCRQPGAGHDRGSGEQRDNKSSDLPLPDRDPGGTRDKLPDLTLQTGGGGGGVSEG